MEPRWMSGDLFELGSTKMTVLNERRSSRSFNLVELFVVAIVVAVLVAFALSAYLSQRDKARDAAVKDGARVVQLAIQTWSVEHGGQYPDASLVSPGGEVGQYIDSWPGNPWTGRPMGCSVTYSRGDFRYESWGGAGVASTTVTQLCGYEMYGLIGWTSDQAAPFVVQPLEDDE
jgi:type II secretory pathway pseudopilin PulG